MQPGWKQAGMQPLPSLTVEHMKSSWYAQRRTTCYERSVERSAKLLFQQRLRTVSFSMLTWAAHTTNVSHLLSYQYGSGYWLTWELNRKHYLSCRSNINLTHCNKSSCLKSVQVPDWRRGRSSNLIETHYIILDYISINIYTCCIFLHYNLKRVTPLMLFLLIQTPG